MKKVIPAFRILAGVLPCSLGLLAIAVICTAGGALAAEAGPTCEASKLGTSAKYAQCRLKADSKAARTATTADYSKCSLSKFESAEDKAGVGVCPSEDDQTDVQNFLDACTQTLADALGGDDLPLDVITCNEDLADCSDALLLRGRTLATGQTTCWDTAGTVIPCAGTGQDGDLQRGLTPSFTDNGDGTITDNNTDLVWEKISNDGSIHSANDLTWAQAFSKITTLNSTSFAGHDDWRLPNLNELRTLASIEVFPPRVVAGFESNCVADCTVTECNCVWGPYWTSTTDTWTPANAMLIDFSAGETYSQTKMNIGWARAVRGGS